MTSWSVESTSNSLGYCDRVADGRLLMSFDTIAAVYVWCSDNHSGQWSRGYRIMSRIAKLRINLTDNAWEAIQHGTGRAKDEWAEAREMYLRLDSSRKRVPV